MVGSSMCHQLDLDLHWRTFLSTCLGGTSVLAQIEITSVSRYFGVLEFLLRLIMNALLRLIMNAGSIVPCTVEWMDVFDVRLLNGWNYELKIVPFLVFQKKGYKVVKLMVDSQQIMNTSNNSPCIQWCYGFLLSHIHAAMPTTTSTTCIYTMYTIYIYNIITYSSTRRWRKCQKGKAYINQKNRCL